MEWLYVTVELRGTTNYNSFCSTENQLLPLSSHHTAFNFVDLEQLRPEQDTHVTSPRIAIYISL